MGIHPFLVCDLKQKNQLSQVFTHATIRVLSTDPLQVAVYHNALKFDFAQNIPACNSRTTGQLSIHAYLSKKCYYLYTSLTVVCL